MLSKHEYSSFPFPFLDRVIPPVFWRMKMGNMAWMTRSPLSRWGGGRYQERLIWENWMERGGTLPHKNGDGFPVDPAILTTFLRLGNWKKRVAWTAIWRFQERTMVYVSKYGVWAKHFLAGGNVGVFIPWKIIRGTDKLETTRIKNLWNSCDHSVDLGFCPSFECPCI